MKLFGVRIPSLVRRDARRLWPAIWLLPENNVYGQWPASGEIDIMVCIPLGRGGGHLDMSTNILWKGVFLCVNKLELFGDIDLAVVLSLPKRRMLR